MRPWRPKAKMRRWKPSNFILKPAHCVIYSNPVFLTGFFVLWSSSCVLQNSCSKEVASSLNKPTSSQFFRKRVGVGVWSAKKQKKLSVLVDKNITFRHRLLYTIHLFRALTTSSAQINLKKRQMAMPLPAMITESVLAGPNFNVISCLCLCTDRWSSFVNLCKRHHTWHLRNIKTVLILMRD